MCAAISKYNNINHSAGEREFQFLLMTLTKRVKYLTTGK